MTSHLDSFKTKKTLKFKGTEYHYRSLPAFAQASGAKLDRLPFSLKILLENLLRYEDGREVTKAHIEAVAKWDPKAPPSQEIAFTPSRILMQDFTGVPAVADLAAMRGAIQRLGGDAKRINPLQPTDLVIDHSVQVDFQGTDDALKKNTDLEFQRNRERYEFLKWAQGAFHGFSVVPPQTGIVHQVNLEYLAKVAWTGDVDGEKWVYPDSLVGTDSHTTMINGLGVLGWGVGGIEAEAAMLGQPLSMLLPQVVGFRMTGKLKPGTTATDLVLTATQMLRKKGVVDKFVEFYGPGLASLSLADRATLANMAPEYGATCGLFPIDDRTIEYLKLTHREDAAGLTEAYYREQGLWYSPDKEAEYSDKLELDLGTVVPSLAGPSRPQDRVALTDMASVFKKELPKILNDAGAQPDLKPSTQVKGETYSIGHGSVVIAAITSCTNTSNPGVLMAAGILAKKAVEKGLTVKPWVKTSLAPGSKVVTDYLQAAGVLPALRDLKFQVVGYGCTTCIGNSGPLPANIDEAIANGKLAVASVLSGNRNFEGRVHASVRANYLASPPLVVAYALAGTVNLNLDTEPLGNGKDGKPVFLKDIWPTPEEVTAAVAKHVTGGLFAKSYGDVFRGPPEWQKLPAPSGELYKWDAKSTYIKEPPYFENMKKTAPGIADIKGARILGVFGDSITTDHISPAGGIAKDSPAAQYLKSHGVERQDFNSYGSRRGNHEVMVRGTFANTRIKNKMVAGVEGGVTKHQPSGTQMSIFDAAMKYQQDKIPCVILAGKEYGTGSSRDWAAKGPFLQGVRAVVAESFERIHRSNLVGMGIVPLQFKDGESAQTLGFDGTETLDFPALGGLKIGEMLKITAKKADGKTVEFEAKVRINTPNELEYVRHGGILQFVLRQILNG